MRTGDASNVRGNHQAVQNWFRLVYESRVVHPVTKLVTNINYNLQGIPVCLGAWASFHGVRPATAAAIHRQVMNNEDVWNTGLAKQQMVAKRQERAHFTNAAAAWWYIRLGYYEIVVDFGYIQCPRDICWTMVYEDEFVPEMRAAGYLWKEPTRQASSSAGGAHEYNLDIKGESFVSQEEVSQSRPSVAGGDFCETDGQLGEHGSISIWYRGKQIALQRWAHEKVGPHAKAFKLVQRAIKHSAYVSPLPTLKFEMTVNDDS